MTPTQGFAPTVVLNHHVRRRLPFAFDRIGERIQGVVVRLSDINDPRGGGSDKRYQIQIRLVNLPVMVAMAAFGGVAGGLKRLLMRCTRRWMSASPPLRLAGTERAAQWN